MTTTELKQYIERVLGNSIRCLLPSYWWKRLFNQVADRIDEVEQSTTKLIESKVEEVKMPIVESVDELEKLKLAKGSVAAVEKTGEAATVKISDCYLSTNSKEDWGKYTIVKGVEEKDNVIIDKDTSVFFTASKEMVTKDALHIDTLNSGIFYYRKWTDDEVYVSSLEEVNKALSSGKYRAVLCLNAPDDYFTFYSEKPQPSLFIKGDSWERLAKQGESGSASVPSYTLYYTTYKVNGMTTMADKYINLNKEEYAKIIASQKAKENYLLQVVELGIGEEYVPVDVELSWFSIADLNDTDGNFNVTVCSFLQRDGANQPQRRLVSFKSDGTAEYELIPTGDVKFLYYGDNYSLSAKEKAHNASAILSIKNSFDSSFTPSPIIIRYKIGSTKYLSLQGILSGNDAEGDGVSLTAFASHNVYYRFNYDLATGEPAKAEVIKTIDSELSDTSENAVQNKVIKAYVDEVTSNVAITIVQEIVDSELVTAAALNDLNDRIKKLEEQLNNAES